MREMFRSTAGIATELAVPDGSRGWTGRRVSKNALRAFRYPGVAASSDGLPEMAGPSRWLESITAGRELQAAISGW